jgi:DNA-binding transcriptional ArsR family regulator
MLQTQSPSLDHVFLALSHPVRRQILSRLIQGAATVTDIAEPFSLSLNAISKHLKILERAHLINREVLGREHYCRVNPQPLEQASRWLAFYQVFWTDRLDALEHELLVKKGGQPLING